MNGILGIYRTYSEYQKLFKDMETMSLQELNELLTSTERNIVKCNANVKNQRTLEHPLFQAYQNQRLARQNAESELSSEHHIANTVRQYKKKYKA
jgi:hypothetical protein